MRGNDLVERSERGRGDGDAGILGADGVEEGRPPRGDGRWGWGEAKAMRAPRKSTLAASHPECRLNKNHFLFFFMLDKFHISYVQV